MRQPLLRLLLFVLIAGCAIPPHAPQDEPELILRGVTLIDGTGAAARGPVDVVVQGQRVVRIASPGDTRQPPTAKIVEAAGRYLIPGLWDAHVHLTFGDDAMLGVLVANGVTGVRDLGGDLAVLDAWKARIESGDLVGPRIYRAGPALDGSKPGINYHLEVPDADAARQAVRVLDRLHVDFVKVHNAVPRDAYFALAAEAKRLHLPLVGHIPGTIDPAEALSAGQRSIEHVVAFFESRSFSRRFTDEKQLLPAMQSWFDTDLPALADLFVEKQAWFTPTLSVGDTRARRGELADNPDPRLRYVAPGLRMFWDLASPITPRDRDPEVVALRGRFVEIGAELTRRLYQAGVPIAAGSDLGGRDVIPGFSMHEEVGLLVKAGLPPMAALQAATLQVPRLLGLPDHGTVEVGKVADLVLLEGDPLADPRNLGRIAAVICRGRYLDRAELDLLLAGASAKTP